MKHDVEYIESISPGRLGQRFSEESSRIVTGLGPELGAMVRAFASMVTGCVLGFYYVGCERNCVIAFPFVFYCGKAFQNSFADYTDVMMQEHQEADTMSEEAFRNIKTVAALGAEKKMYGRYDRIVRMM